MHCGKQKHLLKDQILTASISKGIVLTLPFLLFSFSISAQYGRTIKQFDSIFQYDLLRNTTIESNGQKYTRDDFHVLVDATLPIIVNEFPTRLKINHDNHLFNDKELIRIVDEIDKLPYNYDSLNSFHANEIRKKINLFGSHQSRTKARMLFCNHFLNTPNTNPYESIFNLFIYEHSNDTNHKSVSELIECLQAQALTGTKYNYPEAVRRHFNILYVCDSLKGMKVYFNYGVHKKAEISSAIGDMYSQREPASYQNKAIEYYNNAGAHYLSINDTIQATVCFLKLGRCLLKLHSLNLIENDSMLLKISTPYTRDDYQYEQVKKDVSFILSKCEFACVLIRGKNDSTELSFNLFMLLGNYYAQRGNYVTAKEFFQSAFISALKQTSYTIDNIYSSLDALAWLNSKSGNKSEALKYINTLIDVSKHDGTFYSYWFNISKAKYLGNLGMYEEAIQIATQTLPKLDSIYISNFYHLALEHCYQTLADLYTNTGNTKLAEEYSTKYFAVKSNYVEELNGMSSEERHYLQSISDKTIQKKDASISNFKRVVLSLIAFICVLGTGVLLYWKRYKRRLKEKHFRLNTLTKSVLHNAKNTFNNINWLLINKEYNKAETYADLTANWFSFAVSNWDISSERWTLQDEIDVLNAYADTERALGYSINIRIKLNSVNPDETIFMPEVFNTILNNSIYHGLTSKENTLNFLVSVTRVNRILEIEVRDDGKPHELEDYLRKGRGLYILEQRLENIWKLKSRKSVANKSLSFDLSSGTQIKILFPYVRVQGTNS